MKSNIITVLLFFLIGWLFFFFFYPYHLFFKEQLTLFVSNDWTSYLNKPAFLAEIAGYYLTQFYLLVGGGPTILILVLAGAWWGLRTALTRLKVDQNAGLWALLPIVIEGSLSCQLEYPLSMIIGWMLATWTFVLLTFIKNKILFRVTGIVAVVALYLLAGAHFVTFALLIIFYERQNHRPLIYSLSVLLLTIATPIVASYCYLLTYTQAFYYPIIDRYLLETPFLFLLTEAVVLLTFALAYYRFKRLIAFILLGLMAPLSFYGMSDFQEESNLAFSCEAYFGHWDKVIQLSKTNPYPTYLSAYYTNLANAKAGQLPDRLLDYNQPGEYGLFLESKSTTNYIYEMASPDALIACSDLAQAQHSSMLAMLYTPHQRSSRMARKLAEMAIINEEYDLAKKFLSMLQQTTLHRNWAKENEQLIADKPSLDGKRSLLVKDDILVFTNDWSTALCNLLDANPHNKTALDYLLCLHLLRKDMLQFKTDYDNYYYPVYGLNPPRIYQEALIPCLDQEQELAPQLTHYHISDAVADNCNAYFSDTAQFKGDGRSLQKRFDKTYWFYYYYAQIKQL